MKTSTPPWLLAALGALAITAAGSAGAADPSQWKCESCPFDDEGITGSVDVGAGYVSERSAKFGDFTGLDRKGAFAVLGGSVRYLGADGVYGGLEAAELGLDTRSLVAEHGREGRYRVRLGYAELPRHFSDSARTPFLGTGGAALTLPAGYPAGTTAEMPLASTLRPADLGFERRQIDAVAALLGRAGWEYRLNLRRDVRDGTQRGAGSFFSTAAHLALPVDHVTDQLEATASYVAGPLQASLSYHASLFRNGTESLTWQNPFTTGVIGAQSGQLALAPDNEFHQIAASVGYQFSRTLRASGDVAVGRMTQDADYLDATLNPDLVLPALPAASLRGRVNTLDATLRLSADATPRLRLNASVAHHERDNRTPVAAYPAVATDMFVGAAPRTNTPYGFTRDRIKLDASYRGPGSWRLAAGAEHDTIERTLQESAETREATLWARASVRPLDNLSVAVKLAHAERDVSNYAALASVQPPENPLLRKYNQADRRRDTAGVRADATLGEKVGLGVTLDYHDDDYTDSAIGLVRARGAHAGADLSVAVSEQTRLRLFAQGERMRSRQNGSQQFGAPDWTGRHRDTVELLGAGATHDAMEGKLVLAADLARSRASSDVSVDVAGAYLPFPRAKSTLETLRLNATYRLKDNLSLLGGYAYERYDADDWRFDGVLPATVPNLLAFGEQPPRHGVHVVRFAVRYRF